jgi:hypothetical protein
MGQELGAVLGQVSDSYWATEHAGPSDEIDGAAAMAAFTQWMGPEVSKAVEGGWTTYDGTVTAPSQALLASQYRAMDGEQVVAGSAGSKFIGAEYIPIMVDPLTGNGYLGFFDGAGTHLFGPLIPQAGARLQGPFTDTQLQQASDALSQGIDG